jgi:hypothetical protein
MTRRKSTASRQAAEPLPADQMGIPIGYAHEGVIGVVYLVGCRCRCGHEWFPRRAEKPRVCPECKSPNWDRPRVR